MSTATCFPGEIRKITFNICLFSGAMMKSTQSEQGILCPLTETFYTVDCISAQKSS